jgi:hypothetical protein
VQQRSWKVVREEGSIGNQQVVIGNMRGPVKYMDRERAVRCDYEQQEFWSMVWQKRKEGSVLKLDMKAGWC